MLEWQAISQRHLPIRVSTNLTESGSQSGTFTLIGLRPRGSETKKGEKLKLLKIVVLPQFATVRMSSIVKLGPLWI